MPFQYDFTDELKRKLSKLFSKDRARYEIVLKKVEQIVQSDWQTIDHFKNLRHDLSDRKRVHIDKSFVLTFKVEKDKNFTLFLDFDHHDTIYKR